MGGDNGSKAKRIKLKIQAMWREPKVRVWTILVVLNIGAIICHAKKGSEFVSAGTKQKVYSFFEVIFMLAIDALVIYNLSQLPRDDPGSSCCMKTRCRRCSPCCSWCSVYNVAICVLVFLINVAIEVFNAKVEGMDGSKHKSKKVFFSALEIFFILLLNGLAVLPLYIKSHGDPSLNEVGLNVV